MTYIAYEDWNPKPRTVALLESAEAIIAQYAAQGYTLTLRQLYYQFVARDLIENTERSYKNLGSAISRGRMAGMISWDAIEDRNREYNDFWSMEDPQKAVDQLPNMIRFDYWMRQPCYIEVWVEKEALGNVIERACDPWLVPHMACKGYLSASEAWRAGQRFQVAAEAGKECHLIHLGDHDPSGIDMTRDNRARVWLFSEASDVEVERIALNMDQVEQYKPPPNPAKQTDSRHDGYAREFGNISWELDALEPSVIADLVTGRIEELVDHGIWDETRFAEEETENLLTAVGENWDHVKSFLENFR